MNHINKKGNPYIVDVSNKDITERIAIASGEIKFDKLTYKKINSFKTKKGNLEKTAIVAGIMGAKETSRLAEKKEYLAKIEGGLDVIEELEK